MREDGSHAGIQRNHQAAFVPRERGDDRLVMEQRLAGNVHLDAGLDDIGGRSLTVVQAGQVFPVAAARIRLDFTHVDRRPVSQRVVGDIAHPLCHPVSADRAAARLAGRGGDRPYGAGVAVTAVIDMPHHLQAQRAGNLVGRVAGLVGDRLPGPQRRIAQDADLHDGLHPVARSVAG